MKFFILIIIITTSGLLHLLLEKINQKGLISKSNMSLTTYIAYGRKKYGILIVMIEW